MNLHPIFVHFPIALLTIYSLMEFLRFKKLMSRPYWFYVKALFLMIGGLGALAALYTGDMAKEAVQTGNFTPAIVNFSQVVNTHKNFADLTVAIFGVLAASYLIVWVHKDFILPRALKYGSWYKAWSVLFKCAEFVQKGPVVVIMALLGLIFVTITGGLGGIMVYGPLADPFFGIVYNILFPGM